MVIERSPSPNRASISDAVTVDNTAPGRWVFISGQVAHAPGVEGGDLSAQARGCFDQIESALDRVGGNLSDVVRITAFLTGLEDYPDYDRVRLERFQDAPPASASVQVAGLLGRDTKIEIEAIAFVADRP